ncbi:MAG: hypothetical protein V1744_06180 [Candidatus Altiarchaeota archaeon]
MSGNKEKPDKWDDYLRKLVDGIEGDRLIPLTPRQILDNTDTILTTRPRDFTKGNVDDLASVFLNSRIPDDDRKDAAVLFCQAAMEIPLMDMSVRGHLTKTLNDLYDFPRPDPRTPMERKGIYSPDRFGAIIPIYGETVEDFFSPSGPATVEYVLWYAISEAHIWSGFNAPRETKGPMPTSAIDEIFQKNPHDIDKSHIFLLANRVLDVGIQPEGRQRAARLLHSISNETSPPLAEEPLAIYGDQTLKMLLKDLDDMKDPGGILRGILSKKPGEK